MVNSLGLLMAVFAIIIGVFIFLYFVPINLWITAIFSGVRVGLLELVFMRIRKVPPSIIVNQLITATKAGLSIEDDQSKTKRNMKSSDLETHYLAGGDVPLVIKSLDFSRKSEYQSVFQTSYSH